MKYKVITNLKNELKKNFSDFMKLSLRKRAN
jgi:hypothetical protein